MPTALPSPARPRSPLFAFLRFAGIAGLGWLLDACLLLALVTFAGFPARYANVLSSCTAAVTVFLVSRQTIFEKAEHGLVLRVVCYVGYTLLVIFVASAAMGWLMPWLATLLDGRVPPKWLVPGATALAKVVITPPQLVLNFFASRFMSERRVPGRPVPAPRTELS